MLEEEERSKKVRILRDELERRIKIYREKSEAISKPLTRLNYDFEQQPIAKMVKAEYMYGTFLSDRAAEIDGCLQVNKKYMYNSSSRIYTVFPLDFWKSIWKLLPCLPQVAEQVLVIPPTSAESEQTFSAAEKIIEERRSPPSSDMVDSILRIRSHMMQTTYNSRKIVLRNKFKRAVKISINNFRDVFNDPLIQPIFSLMEPFMCHPKSFCNFTLS